MEVDRPDGSGGAMRPTPVRQSGPKSGTPREPPQPVRSSVSDHRPTPVRDSLGSGEAEGASAADPDLETTHIRIEDVEWEVRVRGRASAGAESGATPLLLLGFFDGGDASAPRREALVVGRRLADLTEHQLESAFRIARPPEASGPREFFVEATGRGRRGDG